MSSTEAFSNALCLALVEERETDFCLINLHEMMFVPTYMRYVVADRSRLWTPPQSEYEKVESV